MKRSKLKNKFNKERNAKNWSDYKQQRNYCSNLFSFKPVSKKGIISAIKKLPSKASISNDILVLVIEQFANCDCEKLKINFERLPQRKRVSIFNESCPN